MYKDEFQYHDIAPCVGDHVTLVMQVQKQWAKENQTHTVHPKFFFFFLHASAGYSTFRLVEENLQHHTSQQTPGQSSSSIDVVRIADLAHPYFETMSQCTIADTFELTLGD